MLSILRVSTLAMLFILVTSGLSFAQQLRDRELRPAFDFTNIQMPVEILSIKLNGKEIQQGEKIMGDDDWLQGLSFTLKNISDKPIAYIEVGLEFSRPRGFVVYSLNYGVDYSRGESRRESSPPAIQPGQTLNLVLRKEKYPIFLSVLAQGGASRSFDTVSYSLNRVSFEGEPDVIWSGGNLRRRDSSEFDGFNVIERYVLPTKQN
jgi:hypothetical protein